MKTKTFATLGILTLALAAPAQAADTQVTSSQAIGAEGTAPRLASAPRGTSLGSPTDEQRYAARDAASPDARKYRAGDVIVISATAVAIILLVVIILILL